MKKIILLLSTVFIAHISRAQNTPKFLAGNKISKTDYLFSSSKNELDINFQIAIKKGLTLHFSMTRMGLWQGNEEFKKHLLVAKQQLKLYEDSVKIFANSKRMDINLGTENAVISRYTKSTLNNDIRIEKEGKLDALKMGRDTLRLVKEYGSKKHQGELLIERVQYTFEMKELKEFASIANEEAWVERTATIIDSVVSVYRNKWRNADAEYHALYVAAPSLDSMDKMFIKKRSPDDFNKGSGILFINGGFGVSLVRNSLCPSVNFGLQYHFRGAEDILPFIRLSMNTFTRFEEKPDKKFNAYGTSFVNAEIGFETNELNKLNKNALISIGLGYMLYPKDPLFRDPSMDKRMYKMFFNYSLSNTIILQPEFISNLGKKDNENGWIGITVNFQLF